MIEKIIALVQDLAVVQGETHVDFNLLYSEIVIILLYIYTDTLYSTNARDFFVVDIFKYLANAISVHYFISRKCFILPIILYYIWIFFQISINRFEFLCEQFFNLYRFRRGVNIYSLRYTREI